MAASIIDEVQAFIAEHHVERPMFKRQRDRSGRSTAARPIDGPENQE